MKNKKLKLYVRKQYQRLLKLLDRDFSNEMDWINDNKKRILNISASLCLQIPNVFLQDGFEFARVFELSRELTALSGGNVTEETVLLTEKFDLSNNEYDFLPTALKINLLALIEEIITEPSKKELAPIAVRSLLLFDDIDFGILRERCVKQEHLLMKDEIYRMSDDHTKGEYRRRLTELSEKSGINEEELCELLLKTGNLTSNLLGAEKTVFSQSIGVNEGSLSIGIKLFLYVSLITVLTAFSVLLLCLIPVSAGKKIILGIISFVPLFIFFTNVVNRSILLRVSPKRPMRLKKEFADTPQNKTLTVITVMLEKSETVKKALKAIEEYFSGNRLDNGVYAILGDLKEAENAVISGDQQLIIELENGIDALNKKYGNRFVCLVRNRERINKRYGGWERKRGAIEQLTEYISEGTDCFRLLKNEYALKDVKYICTLDLDTVLPPESIVKLLCVLTHPLNKEYGLVQARIDNLHSTSTVFSDIMASYGGLNAYDMPSGEVYNDFFLSGTFCGKGMFSLKAYNERLKGKIQPNTVLSHDLLEGEILNTVGANDVTFLDEFPLTPVSYYKRRERWIRGDFQLVPWLFKGLRPVSKWKIFYNLLQPLFSVFVFLQAIIAPFFNTWAYLIWALCIFELSMPMIFQYIDSLRFDSEGDAFSDNKEYRVSSIKKSALNMAFLPYECYNGIVAASKGLWRRLVSRKKVLEWNTFASVGGKNSYKECACFFLPSIILAIAFYFACFYTGTGVLSGLIAAVLWCFTPYLAFRLGKKITKSEVRLLPDEMHSLKILAMRTLRFFYEALEDNDGIMPDNLQIRPYKGYAKRTSPTNIGFALLSVPCGLKLGAYSPGLCTKQLFEQTEKIKKLKTYKGHLYNWYDTEKCENLNSYVSAVDSGNYCAALIAVLGSIEAIKDRKILQKAECNGIGDAIYSCLDGVNNDFKVHLEEYADDFYVLNGKKAAMRARDFLSEGIISSSKSAEFPQNIIKYWLEDYNGLSFSDKIFERIKNTDEFALRPMKEYLSGFPYSVNETLKINNFDKHIDELVWSAGREKYKSLLDDIKSEFRRIYNYAYRINERLKKVEEYIISYLENIDFSSMYDKKKKLLAIGVNGEDGKKSVNCYDILMSEARLTSYIGIALNKLPAESWFRMSRHYTRINRRPVCMSWGGTMFEYLMPDIFIKPSENSMLNVSSEAQVAVQIAQTSKNGIWGISESAFFSLDPSKEYKYKAFGVPQTASSVFKAEKVYSPYSTLLALEYAPRECMDNIIRLVENGCAGKYGMYEAIDFSSGKGAVVYSHMAHHSGMSLAALVNYIHGGAIRKMFTQNAFISAVSVLLEEKMPSGVLEGRKNEIAKEQNTGGREEHFKEYMLPEKQAEEMLVIGDSEIRVEMTSRGNIKIFKNQCYIGEAFVYLKNKKTQSISYYPVRDNTKEYKTVFSPERAEYKCTDKSSTCTLSVFVFEDSDEINFRIQAENTTDTLSETEFVLVLKPALNSMASYESHPYFNGLFIEAQGCGKALKAINRKCNKEVYISALDDDAVFQTDALKVIGRSNDFSLPLLKSDGNFKKYPVTPCLSASVTRVMQGGQGAEVNFILSLGESVMTDNKASAEVKRENTRIFAMGEIRQLGVSKEEWLSSLKIAMLKAAEKRSKIACTSPDVLWRYSARDDIPVMTVALSKDYNVNRFKSLLNGIGFLMRKGFDMQVLVIEDTLEDYFDGAFNKTHRELEERLSFGIFHHLKKSNVPDEDIEKIKALSFLFLTLENEPMDEIGRVLKYVEAEKVIMQENKYPPAENDDIQGEFDCGFGRFISDGKEYYIYARTPMPWSNILTNEIFGTLITESGGGYSWYKNSSLNKLTPWYNDGVMDPVGEALYLRDNKLNRFWSITRDPVKTCEKHDCIYGKGYGIYRYNGYGMKQKQTVFVHNEKSIKIINVSLEGVHNRDISAYYFLTLQMGQNKNAKKYLEVFEHNGMLCAKNSNEYMFIYAEDAEYCSSSQGFFGNNGVDKPQAVIQGEFIKNDDNTPVFALKTKAKEEFNIFIGAAETIEELDALAECVKGAKADVWLEEVKNKWDERAARIQIKTPDRKLDILFNNWLNYQTVASRLYGRTGFYQAGGAYGFRDQLQDCLSLTVSDPETVREHLLKCAAHQFKEGDVQHWWHPEYSGVRTKVSDDLLFLPYVASVYAHVTGDKDIFSVQVPYIEGHSLGEREDLYETAWQSKESGTLYEHCLKAIQLVIKRSGKHSLPLILAGDWNDGMNGLGKKGIGESVWLGWFFFSVISNFLPFVKDEKTKETLISHAHKLNHALNTVCWDGQWYVRAFDDNGRIIGSKKEECAKIDAISQAWSVLSGAGKRSEIAMKSVKKHLIDGKILKLLTPPFTKEYGAGYIGDYIPGIRENGGQYTHAAIWCASAFMQLGECESGYSVLDMINPISHTQNKCSAEEYKLEPYSVAADVYSNEENYGRGGWSWYTASSSLYFCSVLYDLLGINMENGKISVTPHIPKQWGEFEVKIDTPRHKFDIKVINPQGKTDTVESITEVKKGEKTEIRVVM